VTTALRMSSTCAFVSHLSSLILQGTIQTEQMDRITARTASYFQLKLYPHGKSQSDNHISPDP
jgi:hypothetical protein